ncbi:MAG: GNAT family N-acetyltransferase, partial [Bdellovibrionota bacterium]
MSFIIDEKYELRINENLALDEDIGFFYKEEFYNLHLTTKNFLIQITKINSQKVLAQFHCGECDSGEFKSPRRGSFGGMWFSEKLYPDTVESFYKAIFGYLSENGVQSLEIILPPDSYWSRQNAVTINVLLRLGANPSLPELNYDLEITPFDYERAIDHGNRKQLKKAIKEGYRVEVLETSQLREVYDVIVESREKKGFPVTMSYEALLEMSEALPDIFRLFGVYDKDRLIASSVCMAVNNDILYVFYWGDVAGVERFSPITMISQRIYQYCLDKRFRLLDVGTSTVDGIPNHGLVRYKRKLKYSESL